MRIGLINQLHGIPGPDQPTWESLRARATAAEVVGFDIFVFEDALLYRSETESSGCWESVSIAAALAAVTERIALGQSVVNSPYRAPALTAKIADTIDEISGGSFRLWPYRKASPDLQQANVLDQLAPEQRLDKDTYRLGESADAVLSKFAAIAAITAGFTDL